MRKFITIGLFALTSLFTFSGCIDFLEDITYHKNGSGSYQFSIDAGELKSMLESFGDAAKEKDPTNDMASSFDELQKKLENVVGISNFQSINDTTAFRFGFSFDFKNAKALDLALHKVDDNAEATTKYVEGSKRQFTRFNSASIINQLLKGDGADDEEMEMLKTMFVDMKIKTTYHFDRKVKSSSNPNSMLSADQKSVILEFYPFHSEDNKNKEGIGTTIQLKRK